GGRGRRSLLLNVPGGRGQCAIFVAMVVERIARDADSQGCLPVRRERIVRLTEQGGLFVRGPLVNGIAVYAVDESLTEGVFYRQPVSGQRKGRQQRVYDVLIRIEPGI